MDWHFNLGLRPLQFHVTTFQRCLKHPQGFMVVGWMRTSKLLYAKLQDVAGLLGRPFGQMPAERLSRNKATLKRFTVHIKR